MKNDPSAAPRFAGLSIGCVEQYVSERTSPLGTDLPDRGNAMMEQQAKEKEHPRAASAASSPRRPRKAEERERGRSRSSRTEEALRSDAPQRLQGCDMQKVKGSGCRFGPFFK
jgi:hypothetical protein